jgi:hypothetical protein
MMREKTKIINILLTTKRRTGNMELKNNSYLCNEFLCKLGFSNYQRGKIKTRGF